MGSKKRNIGGERLFVAPFQGLERMGSSLPGALPRAVLWPAFSLVTKTGRVSELVLGGVGSRGTDENSPHF